MFQGFHGAGQPDRGGAYGNYSNSSDDKNGKFKKIGIMAIGAIILVTIILTIAGQFTGGITQQQVDLEAILKNQSETAKFIKEYEPELRDSNIKALSAQSNSFNQTNGPELLEYYKKFFTPPRSVDVPISEDIASSMLTAQQSGTYDDVYEDNLEDLVSKTQNSIQKLYDYTDRENLKVILEKTYNNNDNLF